MKMEVSFFKVFFHSKNGDKIICLI
jgi:hypothetical protein